jgi:hypothetical protein
VAADLSQEGIESIKAEETVEKAMAENALQEFEVELGLRSPETTKLAEGTKDLGPAVTDKATQTTRN